MDEYPPFYGKCMTAPVALWRKSVCSAETATILAFGANPASGTLQHLHADSVVGYEYLRRNSRHLFCFAEAAWSMDGWASDAGFFSFAQSAGGGRELVFTGTYLNYEGLRAIETCSPSVRIECLREGQDWRISAEPAQPAFHPAVLP